ncbi:inorganic phosphate transporter [Natronomonas marina]|jgi:PiT family inorganic phosphate transporter|uniref:inorganic phosphate transporter n=1 Tax=Natronomonas marina TaxID=2961939 RepID=UPI0020C95014|nr:inorganic phosphate transporter [Natronomonas marina]
MDLLLVVGLAVAVFVGYNIGGANTAPAFGPAVGAGVLGKLLAAALMTVFFFVGGWTLGREVVGTLGGDIVPSALFTLEASIVVLFFIGFALFVSNFFGVPASTSMTAVGSIAGLGLAAGSLNWETMGRIVSWWIVAPIVAFWVSGVIGRYFYPTINAWVAIPESDGSPFGEDATRRELVGAVVVIGIGCLMAFSSGASNAANAIAPLVGSGELSIDAGIILATVAVGLGAFTIARKTLDTMGNDLTELPLTAAIVVAVVSATATAALAAIGIPASFVIIATMSIVGLGWGRATRTATARDAVRGEGPSVSVGALAADEAATVGDAAHGGGQSPPIGEEEADDIPAASDLFDPETTGRVILMQNVVPAIATLGAFLVFRLLPIA